MKLLIMGAGGHGRVVADLARALGCWSEIAFLDDQYPAVTKSGSWEVVGRFDDLKRFAGSYRACLVATGDSKLRLEILGRVRIAGFAQPALLHPRSVVSPDARIDPGTIVCAGGIVNVGAVVGVGCIVNTGATVDHDCVLQEGVHICPGAHLAGGVSIGARAWIGIGSLVKQGISIGSDVVVGAGAVCLQDIPNDVVVHGVPAREITTNAKESPNMLGDE